MRSPFYGSEPTGRASGIVTGAESANVYDFIDGKISRVRVFLDRDEALKAVGLSARPVVAVTRSDRRRG